MSAAPDPWSERYEALRRHAREGRRLLETDPLGLIVLMRRGLAGWMRGWSEAVAPNLPSPVASSESAGFTTPSWQNELTALLAQMTTVHLQPSAQA